MKMWNKHVMHHKWVFSLLQLIYLIFQTLEVMDRGSETQPQVVENYSYLFNLRKNI